MPRTRNEALVSQARALASEGKKPREISAETGIPLRTVQRYLGGVQGDVRRLPDGQGSRVTLWRQRKRQQQGVGPAG